MKKISPHKLLLTILSIMLACSIWVLPSQAASFKTLKSYAVKNFTAKQDITGDNKKDTIRFKFIHESGNYGDWSYKDKVIIYINGKEAVSFDPKNPFYGISVQYLNMSKTRKFLRISGYSDNDISEKNVIYKYDTKTKKLKSVLDLPTYPFAAGDVTGISSSQIRVAFSGQPVETASINATFTYVYKNGRFKLKSNTAAAASAFENSSFYSDSYGQYFKNSQFKAAKTLTFYKNTARKKVSFTARKGDILKLKKVKMSGKNIYLQFQKGSKKGWKKVFNSWGNVYNSGSYPNGWFYGTGNRLAG